MSRANAELQRPIRLDLNTTPFLNEAAVERAFRGATRRDLAGYPEPGVPRLEAAIAERVGVREEQVIAGNGSDEILDMAIRALVPQGGSIGVLDPSFGMYDHFARASRIALRRVRAREELPLDALAALRADAIFVSSPNNPTGVAFPRDALEALVNRVPVPVVIDEAYAEFARQDLRDLTGRRERVIVSRTFSKAYGLPGIRVGYAIGPRALIDRLRGIRMPYNVSAWSERVALAALEDDSFPQTAVAFVEAERPRLYNALRKAGWPVWPSEANFLFVGPFPAAADVWQGLRERGVCVKLVDWPGGADGQSFRITMGTEAQDDALLDALKEVAP